MARLFGIACIVIAVWVGVEVYTKGVGGALGGWFSTATDAPSTRSTSDRARDAVQRAYDQSEDRVQQQLDPEPDVDRDAE